MLRKRKEQVQLIGTKEEQDRICLDRKIYPKLQRYEEDKRLLFKLYLKQCHSRVSSDKTGAEV